MVKFGAKKANDRLPFFVYTPHKKPSSSKQKRQPQLAAFVNSDIVGAYLFASKRCATASQLMTLKNADT